MSPLMVLFALAKIVVILLVLLTVVAYAVWFERKLLAHMQCRWGPTRVGPHGLLQPLADAIKLLTKEDLTPSEVFPLVYLLAPFLSLVTALLAFAVIPFGPETRVGGMDLFQIADLDIGVLFILSVSSMGVYGIALAGWSSNSKYSLLGGLRSSAQMISYELAIGLSIIGVLLLTGSLSLRAIVENQAGAYWGFLPRWNIIPQFAGFVCFLVAAIAETNRLPFDLPEAETELVAGYHTEYSSMKFGMFFMAEYANMVTASCLATLLFFGGWHGPVFGPAILQALLPLLWFSLKVLFFLFLYVWIRATLPRFRYDQLMAFGWKFLVPLALGNLVVTSLVLAIRWS
ncbi:MAG: NADH-quinone oxidoreductase subunit H [Acidobacteria bacterium RIFCSPLOWO2_02_FULL_61_28]|nr:MAG: NADH-quinone oxidoreductase subunit H [Acidobacteria bacterium RIFCSPLOWO2_02_FULL_61_28]